MDQNKHKLYKNPDKAKVCGVCAGLAEYFGFEVWVVRIIAISLLLLNWFNGTVLLAYFILYFILDPNPTSKSNKGCFGQERKRHLNQNSGTESKPYRSSVKEVWKAGFSPKSKLDDIEKQFSNIEIKLQHLESFVTSKQFELEKEFNKMK